MLFHTIYAFLELGSFFNPADMVRIFRPQSQITRQFGISPTTVPEMSTGNIIDNLLGYLHAYLVLVGGLMNSCSVDESLRELLATIPCNTTGCWGMSTSILPTVIRAELWSFVLLVIEEYRPCDFPMFTVTTVLKTTIMQ